MNFITQVKIRGYYIQTGVGQITAETDFRAPGGSVFETFSSSNAIVDMIYNRLKQQTTYRQAKHIILLGLEPTIKNPFKAAEKPVFTKINNFTTILATITN